MHLYIYRRFTIKYVQCTNCVKDTSNILAISNRWSKRLFTVRFYENTNIHFQRWMFHERVWKLFQKEQSRSLAIRPLPLKASRLITRTVNSDKKRTVATWSKNYRFLEDTFKRVTRNAELSVIFHPTRLERTTTLLFETFLTVGSLTPGVHLFRVHTFLNSRQLFFACTRKIYILQKFTFCVVHSRGFETRSTGRISTR